MTVGLTAVPSLYYQAVMERFGEVCKAKTKYWKLMYITALENQPTRMSSVAVRMSCSDVFVVSAMVKVAVLLSASLYVSKRGAY